MRCLIKMLFPNEFKLLYEQINILFKDVTSNEYENKTVNR